MSGPSIPHESAVLHVTGEALYVDDIPVSPLLLAGRVVGSPHAHARIVSIDLDEARTVPGVRAVLCHRDIPGKNQMGPVVHDEPCLAGGEVHFVGQAVVVIAAETDDQCREAGRRVKIAYDPLPSILDIEAAIDANALMGPERIMRRGNAEEELEAAPHVITGEIRTGAAEHWYLESQVCLCIPGEGDTMRVLSSTQHPSETQALIAGVLAIPDHQVVVEVRRIGGGFGGKETQANHTACWTALLSHATRRPVKIRLSRDDDMIMTGKRHRYLIRYRAGYDDDGLLRAVRLELNSDGGAATDLSFAILERSMLHADNAYYVPHMAVVGRVWRTNLPPNTAFRGFGGPQGMAGMEAIIDRIARALRIDAAEIRLRNFYGVAGRDITHYGQTVEHNRLPVLYHQLMRSSDYTQRRSAVTEFNATHEFVKRGLALTPVKFGIAFTTTFLNQAGALVHIYTDGSILVNHGGTEMGQGLHTKIRQIAAEEFGVALDRIIVNATDTSKVPNTPATAASSGTDLNGMAVRNAIAPLRTRIADALSRHFTAMDSASPTRREAIVFSEGMIFDREHPGRTMNFPDAMALLNRQQVSLSATGFYAVPGIGWDKAKGWGRPFNYYAFGMAVTEAEVDMLSGSHIIVRTDILYDAGNSINPGIDRGQIEGGYVQGLGWCTTEEIIWDAAGNLLTHSPGTYKIPTIRDIPKDFRVSFLEGYPNPGAIHGSKAVAEPPLMLALSGWLAIKDAVSAVADHAVEPRFAIPATCEGILLEAERLRRLRAEGPT